MIVTTAENAKFTGGYSMWAQDTFKPDSAAEKLKIDFRLFGQNSQWLACETMIALRKASGTAREPVSMSVLFAHLWPLFYANPSASMENFLVHFERNGLVAYEFAEAEPLPEATTQDRLLQALLEWASTGTCKAMVRDTGKLEGLRSLLGFSLTKTRDLTIPGAEVYRSEVLDTASVGGADVAVLMPFQGRRRAVYEKAIRPGCAAQQLVCKRADEYYGSKHIMSEIVALIKNSRIVVSDISGLNGNVLYETGIAHAIGKPVLLIAQRGTKVPFDLLHLRRVEYSMLWGGLGRLAVAIEIAAAEMVA